MPTIDRVASALPNRVTRTGQGFASRTTGNAARCRDRFYEPCGFRGLAESKLTIDFQIVDRIEFLGEALLNFNNVVDLERFLDS